VVAVIAGRADGAKRVNEGAVTGEVTTHRAYDKKRVLKQRKKIQVTAITTSCAKCISNQQHGSGSSNRASSHTTHTTRPNITNTNKAAKSTINNKKTNLECNRLRIWPVLDSAVTSLQD
jgi:hypothetical protein